jgi:hypothetical protein
MPILRKQPIRLRLKNKLHLLTLAAVLVIGLVGVAVATAQSSEPTLMRWVFANGGGTASAGGVTLDDTLGQAIAGVSVSEDGSGLTMSGYWPSVRAAPVPTGDQYVYLPFLLR